MRQIFGYTDMGKQRAMNQDAYHFDIGAYPWAVVCDGMGGPRAGDVASGIGVDVITRTIERGLRPDMTENSVRTLLVTALATANTSIHVRAGDDEACAGMGTTAVCALVRGGAGPHCPRGGQQGLPYHPGKHRAGDKGPFPGTGAGGTGPAHPRAGQGIPG